MSEMSRRDALKLGRDAAVAAAVTPLVNTDAVPTNAPDSSADICFMRAVDMAKLIREKGKRWNH